MQNIIQCYKNRPSITKTKENFKNLTSFDFPKDTVDDISLIINFLNPRKATGPDCIPLKVIKFVSNFICSLLCNIIMKDLEKTQVLRRVKSSISKSHFQKNERNNIGNYRSVIIENGMSKIYERFIINSLSSYAETILSNFISVYRKSYIGSPAKKYNQF